MINLDTYEHAHRHNEFQKSRIDSMLGRINVEDIEKGGEGTKGGKIIGHTKSGKPVYANNMRHEEFTHEDHKDAIIVHKKESSKKGADIKYHERGAAFHEKLSKEKGGYRDYE